MLTEKDRRKSGHYTPRLTISWKAVIENDLFIDDFYNEWDNYRDGYRDWFRDFKKIKKLNPGFSDYCMYAKRMRMNAKQKRLLKRRKARKWRNY